jgi:hypothetical protein
VPSYQSLFTDVGSVMVMATADGYFADILAQSWSNSRAIGVSKTTLGRAWLVSRHHLRNLLYISNTRPCQSCSIMILVLIAMVIKYIR